MMIDFGLLTLVGITLLVLGAALYSDLRFHRIPNKLCLIALIAGFVVQTYTGQWQGLVSAFSGTALAFVLLLPAFYFRILGAGDVKLMMAVGSLGGPQLLLWSLGYGIVFGAITSVLLAVIKVGWPGIKATITRYGQCMYLRVYLKPAEGEAAALQVAYAPALAAGWLLACFLNPQINGLIHSLQDTLLGLPQAVFIN